MKASMVIHKQLKAFIILAEAHTAPSNFKKRSGPQTAQHALTCPGGMSGSTLA